MRVAVAEVLLDEQGGAYDEPGLCREVGVLPMAPAWPDAPFRRIDDHVVLVGAAAVRRSDTLHTVRTASEPVLLSELDVLGRLVASELVVQGELERHDGAVSLPGRNDHRASLNRARRSIIAALSSSPNGLLTGDEVRVASGEGTRPQGDLVQVGVLVRVGPFLATAERFAELRSGVHNALLGTGGSVAEIRTAVGLSRKYVVPLLETLDANGDTRRDGERRAWMGSSGTEAHNSALVGSTEPAMGLMPNAGDPTRPRTTNGP